MRSFCLFEICDKQKKTSNLEKTKNKAKQKDGSFSKMILILIEYVNRTSTRKILPVIVIVSRPPSLPRSEPNTQKMGRYRPCKRIGVKSRSPCPTNNSHSIVAEQPASMGECEELIYIPF